MGVCSMSSIPPGDDIFQYEDMLCGPGNVWKQFLQIPQEHQSKLNLVFFQKDLECHRCGNNQWACTRVYSFLFLYRKRTLTHRWIMLCAGEVKSSSKDRLKLLDITLLANIRADGHPNSYREFQPFGKNHKKPIQNDCLHWCLPGPIDTWNDLLVESLRSEIYRWQTFFGPSTWIIQGTFQRWVG